MPFNTVWENWDLFISNGEENDYNGVVPSISLDDVFDATNNTITHGGEFPIFKSGFSLKQSTLYPFSSFNPDCFN